MNFKKILLGTNTFSFDWLICIKKINQSNIIISDFNNENLIYKIYQENIDFIIPLSNKDYLLIQNYAYIDKNKILYPNDDTYNLLNNKLLFNKFMMTYFIDIIPKIFYLDNNKIEDIKYPVISKPIYSTNGMNMKIYHNKEEFEKCSDKIIIQEFIDILYEYGAYLLCINGKIINYKIIKYKYEKFNIKRNNFPKNYEEDKNFNIKLFEPLIFKLNYSGGACINFKFDDIQNKLCIFEINPRFGGSAFTNNFIYELLCINLY
jgi:carbamoylphosphate synthase large subunit